MAMTPKKLPLERARGDTFPFTFVVKDGAGTAIDITGFTFLLTVGTKENPPDITTQLFQLTGTVVNGPLGRVQFAPAANQPTTVGSYYYDVQMTSGGAVRTIIKSTYKVVQDITK